MITQKQIKWASEHDWFVDANYDGIQALERLVNVDGSVKESVVVFTDFKELRDWAGY